MASLGYLYADSLATLGHSWFEDDNYSHGPFIPLISLYLIWLRRDSLRTVERRRAWWGLAIIVLALGVYVIGQFAAMHAVVLISLWLAVVGFTGCVFGFSGLSLLMFPLLYLLAAIPIPEFLHYELSTRLQLLSSALGIGCLQLIGVMAYREGNVIDLGPLQLQVVEACSGLRYLFPLMALTLLCAYLYRERPWKRAVLVLSSIPISILLNGFRIGTIGVLVEWYGQAAAEGFSHFFEGWVFFVASLGLLCGEMWLLARVGAQASRKPLAELIGPPAIAADRLAVASSGPLRRATASYGPLVVGAAFVGLTALVGPTALPQELQLPSRQALLEFPLHFAEWRGTSAAMERQYLEALQVDDYILADFISAEQRPVNVYIAYYQSPKKGRSSHSPRQCIPGGGWEITSFEPLQLPQPVGVRGTLAVNRLVIQKDGHRQVVYYWFKQRDRWMTSEYAVKWWLFWDTLTRHRSDGALVRLVSSIYAGETEANVDRRLQAMAGLVAPELARYVPD
jgi:exosortase D (VPLPA-CTERM-specific)